MGQSHVFSEVGGRELREEKACSFSEATSRPLTAQARYRKNAKMALTSASNPRKVLTHPCSPPAPPGDTLRAANKSPSHVVQAVL